MTLNGLTLIDLDALFWSINAVCAALAVTNGPDLIKFEELAESKVNK